MVVNKPTAKEIKEFWEWCGLKVTWQRDKFVVVEGELTEEIVFLDLNSLFKYAVPKLGMLLPIYQVMYILKDWIETVIVSQKDPTLARFWIIHEVIK